MFLRSNAYALCTCFGLRMPALWGWAALAAVAALVNQILTHFPLGLHVAGSQKQIQLIRVINREASREQLNNEDPLPIPACSICTTWGGRGCGSKSEPTHRQCQCVWAERRERGLTWSVSGCGTFDPHFLAWETERQARLLWWLWEGGFMVDWHDMTGKGVGRGTANICMLTRHTHTKCIESHGLSVFGFALCFCFISFTTFVACCCCCLLLLFLVVVVAAAVAGLAWSVAASLGSNSKVFRKPT